SVLAATTSGPGLSALRFVTRAQAGPDLRRCRIAVATSQAVAAAIAAPSTTTPRSALATASAAAPSAELGPDPTADLDRPELDPAGTPPPADGTTSTYWLGADTIGRGGAPARAAPAAVRA